MPGYGGSAPLRQTTIPELADARREFLDALRVEQPVIVGHSLGGMALQAYLDRHPDRVRAAVLSATSAAFGRRDGGWQSSFLESRLGPLDRGVAMAELAPAIVAGLVGDDPDPDGRAVAESTMAAVPETTYRAMVAALPGFDMRPALAAIRVPCLLLAGTEDRTAPAPMMQRMAARIPGASFAAIDGAGHLANLERPQAFNEALAGFLAGLPGVANWSRSETSG
jgi:3-oxoadipate enol-lactonase